MSMTARLTACSSKPHSFLRCFVPTNPGRLVFSHLPHTVLTSPRMVFRAHVNVTLSKANVALSKARECFVQIDSLKISPFGVPSSLEFQVEACAVNWNPHLHGRIAFVRLSFPFPFPSPPLDVVQQFSSSLFVHDRRPTNLPASWKALITEFLDPFPKVTPQSQGRAQSKPSGCPSQQSFWRLGSWTTRTRLTSSPR